MKKLLVIVLSLVMVFCMFACGEKTTEEPQFTYPEKAVEFIVPYAAGGGNDVMCRAVVSELPFTNVVTNMAGSSAYIGTMEAMNRPADGYTVLVHLPESMQCYVENGTYAVDAADAMIPIACPASDPFIIVIGNTKETSAKFNDLESLKNYKGKVQICETGMKSQNQMTAALFAEQLGIDYVITPYDSGANSRTALLGGNADIFVTQLSETAAYVKSGEMIPLMVCDYNRSSVIPDCPTAKELGFDIISVSHRGFLVAPGTPEDIQEYLRAELKKVCTTDAFKQKLFDLGYDPVWVEHDEIKGFQNDIKNLCKVAGPLL